MGTVGLGKPRDKVIGLRINDVWGPELFHRSIRPSSNEVHARDMSLFIARDIVRNHGGELSSATDPTRGTVVTVSLPLQP